MNPCARCATANPPGSKFCAGCGSALPKNEQCASCGAESPEGSKFCKGCGKPVGIPVPPRVQGGAAPTASTAGTRYQPQSQTLQQVKGMLAAGAGLYAIGIFLMYSELSSIQQMYGAYAGLVADSGTQWFLIILDLACAGLNLYALIQINRGETKLAKTMLIVMIVLGAIFLLRGFSGPILYSVLNAALLAAGVWGWRLLARDVAGPV